MGFSLLAVVKLKLLASSSQTISFTPYVAYLVGPFLLKVFLKLRSLPQFYEDVLHATRFLLFQFSQIAFEIRLEDLGDRSRWERALRLFTERIRRISSPSDEARRLHDLSMVAL